jgi:hypothetical protein
MGEEVMKKSTVARSSLAPRSLDISSCMQSRWAAWITRLTLFSILSVSLIGCSEPTVGQQFRDIMAEIDAKCRKEGLGPYLNPDEPSRSRKRTDGSCEILKVKAADPLATEEGRFAYSIKLPLPHDKAKVEYKKGMSAEAYFKELCEEDAGEWIFKTVEGVEGVFQGRSLPTLPRYSSLVYYVYEASEILTKNFEDLLVQPYRGRYTYLERPRDMDETGETYVRYFRGAENKKRFPSGYTVNIEGSFRRVPYIVNREQAQTLRSDYAFTWRQVVNNDMLENGIVGGETIIYKQATREVLAYRRFFSRYWPREDSKNTRLVNGQSCKPGFTGGSSDFIQTVLVPINPARSGRN